MTQRLVILGGGTAGTLLANRLRRRFAPDRLEITVVDRDDNHVYQPGLLFVPFGMMRPSRLVRSRQAQLSKGVVWRRGEVDQIDLDANRVLLRDGDALPYDAVVVATGASLQPEETDGLQGPGWGTTTHTFYTVEGAATLAGALATFDGGQFVVNVFDMPIKCPVAPLELAFLADSFFRRKGIRDRVEMTFVTPLDGAFTKPVAASTLGGLLERKGIHVETEFNTGEVDGASGKLLSYDGRVVPFDLAVTIPLHGGAPFVSRTPGLGDAMGFVLVDHETLQSTVHPNVFAIGDATDAPASKAGSVAHFEGPIVERNISRFLDGEAPDATFDGHANCFVETGHAKALLIDFNYTTEPLPGRFPSRLGLPLMQESYANHAAKRAFEWFYWHALLPGVEVPGIGSAMPAAGKQRPSHAQEA